MWWPASVTVTNESSVPVVGSIEARPPRATAGLLPIVVNVPPMIKWLCDKAMSVTDITLVEKTKEPV